MAGREHGWLASTTNMTNECRSVVPLLDTLHRRVGASARLALAGTPVNVNGRKGCRFAGAGSYGGLLDGEALSPIVVAPTGIEPVFGRGHVFANTATRLEFPGPVRLPRD